MFSNECTNLLNRQPFGIYAAVITESFLAKRAVKLCGKIGDAPVRSKRRQNDKIVVKLNGIRGVGFGNHLFMNFFPGPYPDKIDFAVRSHRLRNIQDSITRDFGNKNLPAPHVQQRVIDQFHPIFQGYIETGHPFVGDR